MTSVLSRFIAAIRVWLGLNDPADNHMYPPHGWLLPSSTDVRTRALALAFSPAPASSVPGPRR